MAHKTFLAVVCATLLSVSFSSSHLASGGSGKNKKTIIVQTLEGQEDLGSVAGRC